LLLYSDDTVQNHVVFTVACTVVLSMIHPSVRLSIRPYFGLVTRRQRWLLFVNDD